MKARVQRLSLPAGRRVLAVSDIHGNLPYLQGLLEKLRFNREDILIVCGDFLEKGHHSLATLRFLMELSREHRVYPLLGNCDSWHLHVDTTDPDRDAATKHYIVNGAHNWGPGLLAQMCDELGIPRRMDMDTHALKAQLRTQFAPEFDFLRGLPHIIDTERFTFVHGGLTGKGPLEEMDAYRCMKNDDFLHQGLCFEKWVIVGHWPVMLYGGDTTCANPVIHRESRIVSIDGGCVLKDDGQLNGLILPEPGEENFDFVAYDPFPVKRVITAQRASEKSAYIRWGDNLVQVLERGEEFSRCRHIRTGYEMDILTKYLYGDGETCPCNDCTDYVLPLEPGDLVSVVETTGRGYLVKHKGVSGWYFGQLEDI